MSVPYHTMRVLQEVAAERAAQDKKWGEQNHPSGTGPGLILPVYGYAPEAAQRAKELLEREAAEGCATWQLILTEEFTEALAEPELQHRSEQLRTELLQVAAVAVAWVECIDRRERKARAS